MSEIADFFTNKNATDADVGSPAFSITKVLTTAALVIAPVVTVVTASVSSLDFTSGQVVVLSVALMAFVAVLGAADVLARAIASSSGGKSGVVAISPVRHGFLTKGKDDKQAVRIVAVRASGDGTGQFLIVPDVEQPGANLKWVDEAKVTEFAKN